MPPCRNSAFSGERNGIHFIVLEIESQAIGTGRLAQQGFSGPTVQGDKGPREGDVGSNGADQFKELVFTESWQPSGCCGFDFPGQREGGEAQIARSSWRDNKWTEKSSLGSGW